MTYPTYLTYQPSGSAGFMEVLLTIDRSIDRKAALFVEGSCQNVTGVVDFPPGTGGSIDFKGAQSNTTIPAGTTYIAEFGH